MSFFSIYSLAVKTGNGSPGGSRDKSITVQKQDEPYVLHCFKIPFLKNFTNAPLNCLGITFVILRYLMQVHTSNSNPNKHNEKNDLILQAWLEKKGFFLNCVLYSLIVWFYFQTNTRRNPELGRVLRQTHEELW